jgi:hypothetical protein
MNTTFKFLCLAIGVSLCSLAIANAQTASPDNSTNYNRWWAGGGGGFRGRGRGARSEAPPLPLISVKGNKFVDPDGRTIVFRGIDIADPDKIEHEGHWNKEHFEQVKAMGATLVRIPIHPVGWRQRGAPAYLQLLDQAEAWCNDLGMYVIIDWHSIGNLKTEMFQEPMYDTTRKETYWFWRTIAQHFAGRNPGDVAHTTVAFYELFNEPTTYRDQLGQMSWSEWRAMNEEMIAIIRSFDEHKISLVGGLDWAYDLTGLHEDPVRAAGIAYTSHPYQQKRPAPYEPKWEEDFGFAAANYPIIATEFGFSLRPGQTAGDGSYPKAITGYLESKGISWTAWCFDPQWGPTLLQGGGTNYYTLNGAGEYLKGIMLSKLADPTSAIKPTASDANAPSTGPGRGAN